MCPERVYVKLASCIGIDFKTDCPQPAQWKHCLILRHNGEYNLFNYPQVASRLLTCINHYYCASRINSELKVVRRWFWRAILSEDCPDFQLDCTSRQEYWRCSENHVLVFLWVAHSFDRKSIHIRFALNKLM